MSKSKTHISNIGCRRNVIAKAFEKVHKKNPYNMHIYLFEGLVFFLHILI